MRLFSSSRSTMLLLLLTLLLLLLSLPQLPPLVPLVCHIIHEWHMFPIPHPIPHPIPSHHESTTCPTQASSLHYITIDASSTPNLTPVHLGYWRRAVPCHIMTFHAMPTGQKSISGGNISTDSHSLLEDHHCTMPISRRCCSEGYCNPFVIYRI